VNQRVEQVRAQLRRARFFLVTTPQPASQREALLFLRALQDRQLPFHGYLVNRCTPAPSLRAAPALDCRVIEPAPGIDHRSWSAILEGVRRAPARYAHLADADQASLSLLRHAAGEDVPLWSVPALAQEVDNLQGLARLGAYLPPPEALLKP